MHSLFWNTEEHRAVPYLGQVHFLRGREVKTWLTQESQGNTLISLWRYWEDRAHHFPRVLCASGDLLSTCCGIQPHVNTWHSLSEASLRQGYSLCNKHRIINGNVEIPSHRILLNWHRIKLQKNWIFGQNELVLTSESLLKIPQIEHFI